jgi:SAM-dependent methyltransferase
MVSGSDDAKFVPARVIERKFLVFSDSKKEVGYMDRIIKNEKVAGRNNHPKNKMDDTHAEEFDFAAVFDVDDYVYFYSENLTDERTETEVSALVRLLGLDSPKKILDLACGFGRHTNRLAALGHEMTGVDLTPGFLEIARLDAFQREVEVQYQQGDMRTITFEEEFDCVMLLFSAFGYFSDADNLKVMINIMKALKPGGWFIFDTLNRDVLLKEMRSYFVVEKEGNLMIDRSSFDCINGRLYNKRIVIRDGVRKDKPLFTRLYNANEIKALLTQAGLELEHIYGGWEAKEFSSESHRMVVIARKPDKLMPEQLSDIDKMENRMSELPDYKPTKIEPKWQAKWEKDGLYHAQIGPSSPKFYALTMLPYTSGDLHIGHWYAMTPSDARARFKRMQGYNVMFPIGFDAFGLPADRAAMRNGVHPKVWSYANIDHMRKQLKAWAPCGIGVEKPSRLIRNITAGPSGFLSSYTSTDWLTASMLPWTGARKMKPLWHENK